MGRNGGTMPVQYWLLLAAALALLCAQRLLRRAVAQACKGHTLQWRIRIASDGGLRARGLRLRLYGVSEAFDRDATGRCLADLIAGQDVRLRIMSVDCDGTAAIVLRVGGQNVAVELLRQGMLAVRGSGARRLLRAQERARLQRDGLWRSVGLWPPNLMTRTNCVPSPFPWWQG
jgi:hypothetical protein